MIFLPGRLAVMLVLNLLRVRGLRAD